MIDVVTTSIPFSKEELEKDIEKVSKFAHMVQVDISDGIFTRIKTWPYNGRDAGFFEEMKTEENGWPLWEKIDIEVHLMVANPEDVVLDWIHTGISSLVFHIEATHDAEKIIHLCREFNVAVGVAMKPSTSFNDIVPLISKVDFVQVMGNDELGKHGVSLDIKALDLIRQLHAAYPERIIGIDIGVNELTAPKLVKAGVTKLISGSAILDAHNPEKVFQQFESL
jgi:pentose-5-phosphate-3-epimerase